MEIKKDSFDPQNKSIKSNITLGDGRIEEVAGKRTVVMKTKNGLTKYTQDV